jgi:hypothetical protein
VGEAIELGEGDDAALDTALQLSAAPRRAPAVLVTVADAALGGGRRTVAGAGVDSVSSD